MRELFGQEGDPMQLNRLSKDILKIKRNELPFFVRLYISLHEKYITNILFVTDLKSA